MVAKFSLSYDSPNIVESIYKFPTSIQSHDYPHFFAFITHDYLVDPSLAFEDPAQRLGRHLVV